MSAKLAILAVSAAVVGSTAATQLLPWQGAELAIPVEPVELFDPTNVMMTQAEAVTREHRVGATVVPARRVTLTAQIPGAVRFIGGGAGDEAAAGGVLVEIDRSDMMSRRHAAVAQLRRAESALQNARVQYQRQLHLSRSGRSRNGMGGMMPFGMDRMMNSMTGGGPNSIERGAEVFDSRTGIAKAQNAVLTARSQIDEIDAAITDSSSRAPFAGVIFEKLVEQGDTVQPGQPLMVFADVSELQVEVDVPSRLSGQLEVGSVLEIELDGVGTPVMARVKQVFPMADLVSHTIRIKVALPSDAPATAGMYAAVVVPDDTPANAGRFPVVPATALTYREGLPMVYVVDANGQPRLRLVRLGGKTDSGIAVTSGLKDGEQVLVDTIQYSAGLAKRGPSA